MPITVLLAIYLVAIFVASVLGGRLAETITMTHARSQIVLSLVGGFILGIAIFHLLPHSFEHLSEDDGPVVVAFWIMAGLASTILLLHVFHFDQHGFTDAMDDPHDHDHQHDHDHAHIHEPSLKGNLLGVVLGLSLHSVAEGMALGASSQASAIAGGIAPSLGVFFAICVHKPLDAYSITAIMKFENHTRKRRTFATLGYAVTCPLATLGAFFGFSLLDPVIAGPVLGRAFAFAVGAFLCIALTDLLPEIHFHRHDRWKLLTTFALGILLAYGLYFLEVAGVDSHAGHAH